jgi:hypothetical protein
MTPFHPTFRRLLRRNIPQLKDEDLNRHEGLFALRHHLVLEKHIGSREYEPPTKQLKKGRQKREKPQQDQPPHQEPPEKGIDKDIAQATEQAQAIFVPYAREYEASLRLWVARRQLMLQQSNFFQIPFSWRRFKRLVAAIWNYRNVQLATFFTLAANRIKYYAQNLSVGKLLGIVILVALLIIGLYTLTPKQRPGQVQQGQIR